MVATIVNKSSETEEKVTIPNWVTDPNLRAAFRKLPADEQASLAGLPPEERRGAVRQAAIAAGIVKVPSIFKQFLRLWLKATPEERAKIRDFCNATD